MVRRERFLESKGGGYHEGTSLPRLRIGTQTIAFSLYPKSLTDNLKHVNECKKSYYTCSLQEKLRQG